MLNELSNDPIQRAIARLEKQHEEDKQVRVYCAALVGSQQLDMFRTHYVCTEGRA